MGEGKWEVGEEESGKWVRGRVGEGESGRVELGFGRVICAN